MKEGVSVLDSSFANHHNADVTTANTADDYDMPIASASVEAAACLDNEPLSDARQSESEPETLRPGASQVPPASDPALQPAAKASAKAAAAAAPQKPKRQLGALRVAASNTLRRFWLLCRFRARLRLILRCARVVIIQALFRARRSRRAIADTLNARRNSYVIAKYATQRSFAALQSQVPPHHVAPLAARSIQLMIRCRWARLRYQWQRRHVGAKKIQRFYRAELFKRFMSTVADRRVLRDRRAVAVTKIQSAVRGFLARRWFRKAKASLQAAAGNKFPLQQRAARQSVVAYVEQDIKHLFTREQARIAQVQLLDRIRQSQEPNRDVVLWSASSLVQDAALGLQNSAPQCKKTLTMVPAATGKSQFVSQARALAVGSNVKYLESCAFATHEHLVTTAKRSAKNVAQREIAKKRHALGKYPEETPTMRYALENCECVDY